MLVTCALLASAHLSPADADSTVTVSTTTDETTTGNGTCSLREAILYANGTAETDCGPAPTGITTIVLPGGHYVLSTATGFKTLSLTGNAIIEGAGAGTTLIDGGSAVQVLSVGSTSQSTISGVTITGGVSGGAGCGGFCFGAAGAPGGGIANAGVLTLANSVVSNNTTSAGVGFLLGCLVGHTCNGLDGLAGGAGGGIYNAPTGKMAVTGSTITGNTTENGANGGNAIGGASGTGGKGGNGGSSGAGGGIDNAGAMTITSSSITNNATGRGGNGGNATDGSGTGATGGAGGTGGAPGDGGGIENTGSSLAIKGSTVSGNRTGAGGNGSNSGNGGPSGTGGVAGSGANGGTGAGIDSTTGIVVQNSTITGNATGGGGAPGTPGTPSGPAGTAGAGGTGAALNQSAAGATLTQDTIASNNAAGVAGGLDAAGGQITYANTIVASNHGGAVLSNCAGAMVTDQGNNIVFGDASCNGPQGPNPNLGALADNGGPTQTMGLPHGSPAVDFVPVNACPLTTDQRGVARPQGSGCDAGAYELAPPSIGSPVGKADGTTSANVTAAINPNFKSTSATVRYGTTTAYGSTTSAQNLGAGNTAVAMAATLAGLKPSTTYHAQVVASNADGTSTSGDISFVTSAPLAAAINATSATGSGLSLTISCAHGNPGDICKGPIALTAHQTTQGGRLVAVASTISHKKARKHQPKRKTTQVTLVTGKYSIASGTKKTLKLTLDKAGQALLTRFYRLPATLSIRGTTPLSRTVTFSYQRLHLSPAYQWAFSRTFAFATQLTLAGLPRKSHVAVVCHGHGCPFAKKSFARPKRGKLDVAPALKQRHLTVGSTVDLQITAANTVGEVVRFTVLSGKLPKESFLCLPPSARTPSACTS
ncbi:MAG TPA: fibronectin type III domain-containing protein [Solirubrobacteraceae bacterium]|nr:fibronectin type III domain-containing protein [Solirubrobacteraceae bacterium]